MKNSFRSKPVGWRGESHRHYLASKGIKTKVKYYAGKAFPDFGGDTEEEKLENLNLACAPSTVCIKSLPDGRAMLFDESTGEFLLGLIFDDYDAAKKYATEKQFIIKKQEHKEPFGYGEQEGLIQDDDSGDYMLFAKKDKLKEGVYETEYGNAAELSYDEDGKLHAYDIDAARLIPLSIVTKKFIRKLEPGEGDRWSEGEEDEY